MIRSANYGELNEILKIYASAREFMKKTGNPTQWGNSYPPEDIIKEDIIKKQLFVFEENGEILGAFVYFKGVEPLYEKIDGAWRDNSPYGVIHRVANGGKIRGMVKSITEFADTVHLRIDTHKDNTVMQHVLEKNGFVSCGTIYLENGEPRIAYEKI